MDQPHPQARSKAPQRAKAKGPKKGRSGAPKKPVKRKKNTAVKWLGGIVGLFAIVVVGAYIVLTFGPVRAEFLRGPILSQLSEKMGDAEIEMGDIYLTTHDLGLGVLVESVDVAFDDGQSSAKLGQLKFGFSPFAPILSTGSEVTIAQADVSLPAEVRISTMMHNLIVEAADNVPGTQPLTQADIVAHLFDQAAQNLSVGFEAFEAGDIERATIDNLSVIVGGQGAQETPIRGGQFEYRRNMALPGEGQPSFAALKLSLPAQPHQIQAVVYDQSGSDAPQYRAYFTRAAAGAAESVEVDSDAFIALNGPLSVELDLLLAEETSRVASAKGAVKTSNGDLRLGLEDYGLAQNQVNLHWQRGEAGLTVAPSDVKVGQASANISGLVDLDPSLSDPSIGLSLEARNLRIDPSDMQPSQRAFQQMILRARYAFAQKKLVIEDINIVDRIQLLSGRAEFEFAPEGIAITGDLEAEGASIDQTMRLWPSFISTQTRAWVNEHVLAGRLEKSYMQFRFPAGSIKPPSERARIPQDGLTIDIAATDMTLSPGGALVPISSSAVVSMAIRDHRLAATVAKARMKDEQGVAELENVSYEIPDTFLLAPRNILSARVKGAVNDILRLADKDPINVMEALEIGLGPEDFKGQAALDLQAQFTAGLQTASEQGSADVDYTVTGAVTDFSALKPVEGRNIEDGTFTFSADTSGFALNGTARLNGTVSDLALTSAKDGKRDVDVRSVLNDKQRADLGLELLNDYISGPIAYRAKPREDGALEVDVSFKEAEINLSDLAVKKPKGTEAVATFLLRTGSNGTTLENFDFRFEDVSVKGDLSFDAQSRLIQAAFPTFKLTSDDTASLNVARVQDGFEIRLKGEQMNLQSILTRFFGIEEESRLEAQTDIEGANLTIIADIGRAIGFFKTTAFNVKLNIKVRGPTLISIAGRASLGGDKTLSVSTNPLGSGKVITYAANDVGTMMRFIGLYPRLLGGVGSLVVDYNEGAKTQSGQVALKDFALINEGAMVRIVGNHTQSKDFVSAQERLVFRKGLARFTRSEQELVVQDLTLEGPQMGLTMRGRIDSLSKQIDMVGTYIPLFGLNTALKDVPIIGQLQGDGLIGVTFAIRGALADPQFAVNPASALAPGVFRRLFEFQQRN